MRAVGAHPSYVLRHNSGTTDSKEEGKESSTDSRRKMGTNGCRRYVSDSLVCLLTLPPAIGDGPGGFMLDFALILTKEEEIVKDELVNKAHDLRANVLRILFDLKNRYNRNRLRLPSRMFHSRCFSIRHSSLGSTGAAGRDPHTHQYLHLSLHDKYLAKVAEREE